MTVISISTNVVSIAYYGHHITTILVIRFVTISSTAIVIRIMHITISFFFSYDDCYY